MYFDLADRILAILRTPRGEKEAWCAFLDALDEFEAAANLWADPEGPTAADMERLRQSRQRVIECARALAALRTSHGEGEADEHASCTCEWMHPTLGTINPHWPAVLDPECIVHREADWHSEAQGEDRWEDVVFGPITEAYNEAHDARRSEGGGA